MLLAIIGQGLAEVNLQIEFLIELMTLNLDK
jgi:hypothetical protein